MKITSIEAQAFSYPLPRHFKGSNYVYTHKKGMFAKAATDAGIEGFCYLGDDFGLGAKIAEAVNTDFAKLLIGRDPVNTADIWQDMRPLARDILGDRRVLLHAQALCDILCWDLRAKAAEKSLVDLLGQKQEKTPIIAIAGYYKDGHPTDGLKEEIHDLQALGCQGIKLKVGGLSIADDVARVRAVRAAGGASFLLAVDANQGWSLKEAVEFSHACEDQDIFWIEEPVHWDNDIKDLAALRKETDIPICAGQSEISVAGIARLIDAGAVDICNLHAGYAGGITPWLEAAELARKNGLKVANTGEPQFSASLILACEHGMGLEIYHPDRDPVFPRHCPDFSNHANGCIGKPSLLGLGIIP